MDRLVETASGNGKGACSSTVSAINNFKTVSAVGPDVIKLYLARRFLMEYALSSSVRSVTYHHPWEYLQRVLGHTS